MANKSSIFQKLPRTRRPRLARVVDQRLKNLPFHHHPGLKVNAFQEGYHNFIFGSSAGPDCCFENLAHELAHAAEFGPDQFQERGSLGSFNFKLNSVIVMGEEFSEPATPQATQRECRTAGLQWRLMELAGYRISPDAYVNTFVRVMGYMPDWHLSWGDLPREKACRELILSSRESCQDAELLDRIVGWLDLSHKATYQNRASHSA